MWNLFYRNTRLLILTICLIVVWGLFSYQLLPRMEDPEISQQGALITTRFPGASAERLESLVTEKIEQELLEISELKEIRSFSRPNVSLIELELKDEVVDRDSAWSRVRDRLSDVLPELPEEVLEPEYQDIDTKADTLLVALTWNQDSPPNYTILSRLAEELETQLRSIGGTEKIEILGSTEEEIVVEVNPTDLSALNLTSQELSRQILQSDAKVSAGQLRGSTNDFLMEVEAEIDSLERIRQIPIRLGSGGQVTRLGDIALVKKELQQPPAEMAIVSNQPAIVLAVMMESNQRIDRWSKDVKQTITNFQENLPDSLHLQVLFDQSYYVDTRINGLFLNLLLGILCVVFCTVLLMGWRSALVVSCALPLSVLMVFGGMRFLAIPMHQMSLTGLVIALGMLIDNAIVVVDEVQSQLKRGIKPQEAVSKSTRYLAVPLLASTLTTVLTFLPIVLLPGATGEFVRAIALSVILALFSSLFLSLTVIPALAGMMHKKARNSNQTFSHALGAGQANSVLPPASKPVQALPSSLNEHNLPNRYHQQPKPKPSLYDRWQDWWSHGISFPILTWLYRCLLDLFLAKPTLAVVLSLILPLTGFLMASTLEEQFFPPTERGQLQIEIELPSSASIQQTRIDALQAREIMLNHPEVTDVHWFLGRNAPTFYYNLQKSRKNAPNYAHGMIQLESVSDSRQLVQTLQNELDQALPSAQVLVRQLEQGPPVAAPIELRLYGSDLDTLRDLGNQVRRELSQVEYVIQTRSTLSESLPVIGWRIDEEQARLAGISNTEVAQQLNANLEGSLGGSLLEFGEEMPVRVRVSNQNRSSLDQIASFDLMPENNRLTQEGSSVPLSAVGETKLVSKIANINRRNGVRMNIVQGYVTAGVLPSTVLANFQQQLAASDFQLPSGYSMEFGGESAERNQAVGNLISTVGILLVLMMAILCLSFGSFRAAGIIAIVAVCSVGLGLASLWIFSYPLGFMAILGTVSLVGIAINDSIVVLAALRADAAASQGECKAIREVIVHSTRHVLTTTLTTMAGFLPLLIDGGQFWPPLAICISGGISGATFLALFFVPCVYLLLNRQSSGTPVFNS